MSDAEKILTTYFDTSNMEHIFTQVASQSQDADVNISDFKNALENVFAIITKELGNPQSELAQNISLPVLNEFTTNMVSGLLHQTRQRAIDTRSDGTENRLQSSANIATARETDDVLAHIFENQVRDPRTFFDVAFQPDAVAIKPDVYSTTSAAPVATADIAEEGSPPGDDKAVLHTISQVFSHIPRESRNNTSDSRHIPIAYFVDSRDRDSNKYAEPNDYVVPTNYVYRNVTSITLLSCVLPNTIYNIYENNNLIHFEETNGVVLTAEIPPGDYDLTTLPVAIKTALETVGNSTYTVTIDATTSKITITSDLSGGGGIFTLRWAGDSIKKGFSGSHTILRENSMGTVLGFLPTDLSGVNSYTATGIVNLNTLPYLLLFLENIEKYESTESGGARAFCQVYRNIEGVGGGSNGNTVHNIANSFVNTKHFSPPLAKLDRLHITFRDYWGNIVDFNSAEHSLLFEITSVEDIDRKI